MDPPAGKWILCKHDDDDVVEEEGKNKSKSSTINNKRKKMWSDLGTSIRCAVAKKKKRKMNNMSKQEEEEEEKISNLYAKSSSSSSNKRKRNHSSSSSNKRKRNHSISLYRNKRRNKKMLNYKTREQHHNKSSSSSSSKNNDDVYKAIRYVRKRKMNCDQDTILSKNKRNNPGKAKATQEDNAGAEILSSSAERYLSKDLIFNILSRTCVTSLFRCKSVCKLWHSIISTPKFHIAHHLISVNKLPSIIMITSRVDDNEGCHAATILYPDSLKHYSVNIPLMPPFDLLQFVSSSNGVVCVFHNFKADLYLLNPLTRMSKKLMLPPAAFTMTEERRRTIFHPPPPTPVIDKPHTPFIVIIDNPRPVLKAYKVEVGFGFDCVSCDFKVLFLEYQKIDNKHVGLEAAHLYSSNSDSWRVIKVDTELPSFLYYPPSPVLRSGPVVDGVLYMEGVDFIITFDLHTELFGLISYPSFVHARKSNVLNFEGSVAVVLKTVPDGSLVEKELSLWTPIAVSGEVVWNKMFTFGTGSEEIDWLFLYFGANQFFGKTRLGEMLYDYRKKQTKYVEFPSQSFLLGVLSHTESFLPAEGLEGFTDS
ncbi:hypothetical protein AgCh_014976 [Apium graveolens]